MPIEIIILAGMALFLFWRLRDVLGQTDGDENPAEWLRQSGRLKETPESENETVVRFPARREENAGPMSAYESSLPEDSPLLAVFQQARSIEPQFNPDNFIEGAGAAYEMILIAFETGDKAGLKPYLADDVYRSFISAIDERQAKGLNVEAQFIGLRNVEPLEARVNAAAKDMEIDVEFAADMIVAVKDTAGSLVDGSETEPQRHKDRWTFRRRLGRSDPNWILTATS